MSCKMKKKANYMQIITVLIEDNRQVKRGITVHAHTE